MKLAAIVLAGCVSAAQPTLDQSYHCQTTPVGVSMLEITPQSAHVLAINEYSNLFDGATFGNGSCLDNGVGGFDCSLLSWQQAYEAFTFVPDDTFEFVTFSFEGKPRTFQCTTEPAVRPGW